MATPNLTSVNGNQVYGRKLLSMAIISTLLNSCPVAAAMGIKNANKMDTVFQAGTPDKGMAMSGANLPPTMVKDIMEASQYNPLNDSIFQFDVKSMTYRDTNPTVSTGTGATFTATITAGVIVSVAVSLAGTGYAGAAPTMIVSDIGGGAGAVLRATISGGSVTGVTVLTGGYGYSGSTAVTANSGYTAGTKAQRAQFRWTQNKSVGTIYNRDIRRSDTLSQEQNLLNVAHNNSLLQTEQMRIIGGQIQRVNQDIIFGQPSDQDADPWDSQFGMTYAFQNNNNYAGVDRSLTSNDYWRGIYDTSAHTFTLAQMWADVHLNRGLSFKGGNEPGADLFAVGPVLFNKWQQEQQAYTTNVNTDPNVQLLRREFGFKNQLILYNNTYVIVDPLIPPNSVYACNTRSMVIAFRQGANFNLSQLYPQEAISGGIDGKIFYLDTQYMFMCQAPALNAFYTNVS